MIGWVRYLKGKEESSSNQTFEIIELVPSSIFGKPNWYEVVFYSTTSSQAIVKEVYKTTGGGKLKLRFPESKDGVKDYSYKITHLGESKKQPK